MTNSVIRNWNFNLRLFINNININNEYLFGVGFLFGGITMGWDDWKTFLTKKKS